jgi:hypothetical protein
MQQSTKPWILENIELGSFSTSNLVTHPIEGQNEEEDPFVWAMDIGPRN